MADMKSVIPDPESAYHLQQYAIVEGNDGNYEYIGWDTDSKLKKTESLSWIRGKAAMVEDILCLGSITSEGEEEEIETKLELDYELRKLPKWDKSKYYCVVLGGRQASLLKSTDSGDLIGPDAPEYKAAQETLKKSGIELALG
jgi:hypothetical protein